VTRTTPTLPNILDSHGRLLLESLWVSLPATVESYDSENQTVNAQPLVKKRFVTEEGVLVVERLPVVPMVPVIYQGSSRGRLTTPPARGDGCLLVFTSCSLDRWISHGTEVDPEDDRRGDLTDAFAILGVVSPSRVTDPAHATAVVLQGDDVRLGDSTASGTDARVAIRSDLQALKDAISDAATDVDGAILKASLVSALSGWPVCATKVRAK
jgi:hypothetical protein